MPKFTRPIYHVSTEGLDNKLANFIFILCHYKI